MEIANLKTSKTEPRVTIVCCYNKPEIYKRELLTSLEKQNESFFVIGIDNSKGVYSSCSSALNSVINQISTQYVVFSHQDIVLPENDMLKSFVNYMRRGKVGDIFGVAGTSLNCNGVITSIRHGNDKQKGGKNMVLGCVECDVIDECFFGGLTQTFRNECFDEQLCDDWHLYAVEQCLRGKINNNKVYVCDIKLIHTSKGTLSHKFHKCFLKLCKAYHDSYKEIYTPCTRSKTDWISRNVHYLKKEIGLLIHRKVR